MITVGWSGVQGHEVLYFRQQRQEGRLLHMQTIHISLIKIRDVYPGRSKDPGAANPDVLRRRTPAWPKEENIYVQP